MGLAGGVAVDFILEPEVAVLHGKHLDGARAHHSRHRVLRRVDDWFCFRREGTLGRGTASQGDVSGLGESTVGDPCQGRGVVQPPRPRPVPDQAGVGYGRAEGAVSGPGLVRFDQGNGLGPSRQIGAFGQFYPRTPAPMQGQRRQGQRQGRIGFIVETVTPLAAEKGRGASGATVGFRLRRRVIRSPYEGPHRVVDYNASFAPMRSVRRGVPVHTPCRVRE